MTIWRERRRYNLDRLVWLFVTDDSTDEGEGRAVFISSDEYDVTHSDVYDLNEE